MSEEPVKPEEPVKSVEPVKVKMTLRAARPTVGGTSSSSSSAAAAVESVEARLKKESEERAASKENSSRYSRKSTGCLVRIALVLAVAGCIWYFFGEKFLLPEYTFPKVWQQVQGIWK